MPVRPRFTPQISGAHCRLSHSLRGAISPAETVASPGKSCRAGLELNHIRPGILHRAHFRSAVHATRRQHSRLKEAAKVRFARCLDQVDRSIVPLSGQRALGSRQDRESSLQNLIRRDMIQANRGGMYARPASVHLMRMTRRAGRLKYVQRRPRGPWPKSVSTTRAEDCHRGYTERGSKVHWASVIRDQCRTLAENAGQLSQ